MGDRLQVTEYLDLDLGDEMWYCSQCNYKLISARENYKKGCLVCDRDPRDVHPPIVDEEINFAPDPNWVRILEFYCPGCGKPLTRGPKGKYYCKKDSCKVIYVQRPHNPHITKIFYKPSTSKTTINRIEKTFIKIHNP